MSWTGRRLRWHSSSNYAGVLTKTQRQHFAESRATTLKGSRHVSPPGILRRVEKTLKDPNEDEIQTQGGPELNRIGPGYFRQVGGIFHKEIIVDN